ncbi:MAG TPA: TauD/TfdA family dioxygenase [Afifellaceae bacterium]|nr:TauD/TfdA family dioxygenase [Afifellaceae bacterium]
MANPTATHPAATAETLPETPDFDVYPVTETIAAAETEGGSVTLTWSDGRTSRYHALWLRENAADEATINPLTREATYDFTAAPEDLHAASVGVDAAGALAVRFEPEGHETRFHPGWLRAHDYSDHDSGGAPAALDPVAPQLWTAADMAEPPTFDGAAILTDDAVLESWLTALARFGVARLRDVATEPGMVGRVARRIGTVRDSNFGLIFDVRARPDPDSNAYTSLALPAHTDLPTREYQPGLQFLHCMENSTAGGNATYVDGFAVADHIRRSDADAFRALTEIDWTFTNRARNSDYRWRSPTVVLGPDGGYREVRLGGFLRGPLAAPFDKIGPAYRALKLYTKLAGDPAFQLAFAYRPGDLVGFDNRRVLHGREAFDAGGGARWLQGCYGEREELHSRLRVLARNRRAAGG